MSKDELGVALLVLNHEFAYMLPRGSPGLSVSVVIMFLSEKRSVFDRPSVIWRNFVASGPL